MNISHRCVFCGNTEVVTTMNIIIDAKKYEIGLCTKCGEEATMGRAKTQLEKELVEFEQLKNRAALFNMDLVPKGQIIPPTPSVIPVRTQIARVPPKSQMVNTATNPAYAGMDKANKAAYEAAIKEATKNSTVKLQKVSADKGDIVIPKSMSGNAGDTDIKFVKISDHDMQKRFKTLSRGSIVDQGPDYRHQYDMKDCPACQATGTDNNGNICTTCNGKTIL